MDLFPAVRDFLFLMGTLVAELWRSNVNEFLIACATGVVLAGIAWWLTNLVAQNYNRQFDFHSQHHIFCGLTAIFTLVFTILFFAFSYAEDVADVLVTKWETTIQADAKWSDDTFRKAYEAVYDLRKSDGERLEDFSGKPHPDTSSNTVIPTGHEASKQAAAETYAKGAVEHFSTNHPFLSLLLWAKPGAAEKAIYSDMKRFFDAGPDTYPLAEAIQLAGKKIKQGLQSQLPRTVLISRVILVIIFLLIQGLTLLLLIRAALHDIKVVKYPKISTG